MNSDHDPVQRPVGAPAFDDGTIDPNNRRAHAISGIDHIQIAVPAGQEKTCRDFYLGVLGLEEIPRAGIGVGRSFLWVSVGKQEVHFRPDPEFAPARFAHPGFLVGNADALASALIGAGFEVSRSDAIASGRFHTRDPFGNRLEFIESGR